MKAKFSEYSNVIKCEVKLIDRRVTVLMLKNDGSFQFEFKRLDVKEESVVIEQKNGRLNIMKFRLSIEATQALILCISKIVKYEQSKLNKL